jgi:hypothetical protein
MKPNETEARDDKTLATWNFSSSGGSRAGCRSAPDEDNQKTDRSGGDTGVLISP